MKRLIRYLHFSCAWLFAVGFPSPAAFYDTLSNIAYSREQLFSLFVSVAEMAASVPDSLIASAINDLRENFKEPHPYLNMPRLDPYFLEVKEIGHELPELTRIDGSIKNVTLTKLSSYKVKNISIFWFQSRAHFSFFFDELYLDGFYKINGTLGGETFPIFGEGPFHVIIYGLNLCGNTTANFYNQTLRMDSFEIDYNIQRLDGYLENFMGGGRSGNLSNEVFMEKTPEILEKMKPQLLPIMSSHILNATNEYLEDMSFSPSDVISWIPGTSHVQSVWRTLTG